MKIAHMLRGVTWVAIFAAVVVHWYGYSMTQTFADSSLFTIFVWALLCLGLGSYALARRIEKGHRAGDSEQL